MRCVVSTNGNATGHLQRALALHFFGEDIKFIERPWPINPPFTGIYYRQDFKISCYVQVITVTRTPLGALQIGDHPSKDKSVFPTVYPNSAREST